MQRSQILAANGQPLYLLWAAVDEHLLDEIRRCLVADEPLPNQPWEATGTELLAAWERLTRRRTWPRLEEWGRDRATFQSLCPRMHGRGHPGVSLSDGRWLWIAGGRRLKSVLGGRGVFTMWIRYVILMSACLLAIGCSKPEKEVALTEGDEVEAVRFILLWLTGEQRLPGFNEDCPDPLQGKEGPTIFLISDFLPAEAKVTTNPRFRRVSEAEYRQLTAGLKDIYKIGAFVRITVARTEREREFVVTKGLSMRAGHKHQLTFRKTAQGLWAKGKLLEVW